MATSTPPGDANAAVVGGLEYIKTLLIILLGGIKIIGRKLFSALAKLSSSIDMYWPVIQTGGTQLGRLPAAILLLIKELVLLSIFSAGPFLLLVVVFSSAGVVCLFLSVAKRLKWNQTTALALGHDAAAIWMKLIFKVWHGQEFVGIENIPPRGGALVVWYHGPMPADYLGLIAEIQFQYGRQVKSIMDRFLKKIPGSEFFIEKMGCTCEGRDIAVKRLKDGELLGVAPGGSREALFCQDYTVEWGKRVGFARVALDANVPIIPIFTENIREAYTLMRSLSFLWRYIYEASRLPAVPVWGGYPVKLITHIGAPIFPAENETPESFRDKAKLAVEDLMRENQRKNPSVFKALIERFIRREKKAGDTMQV